MHEQSLMNDLMAKIEAIVKENNAERAVAIDVWLGALSHMSQSILPSITKCLPRGRWRKGRN